MVLREYDKLGEVQDDPMARIGIKIVSKGEREAVKRTSRNRFNQEKIYHISQIEKLANKYALRFLPSNLYVGSIDAELPSKISQFEIAYNIKMTPDNCFILAPAESFQLKVPKDPLLFYEIDENHFYLIHKWGNDLNIFRMLKTKFIYWFVLLPFTLLFLELSGNIFGMACVLSFGTSIAIGMARENCKGYRSTAI